jgi:hypothetical protein
MPLKGDYTAMLSSKRETVYEDKILRVVWDPRTGVVEAVALGQMTSPEFRAALERLLAALKDKRARKCLADLGNAGNISLDDLLWSNSDWFPRCLRTSVKVFALVMPKSLAGHMAMDKATQNWAPEKTGNTTRAFFSDVASAKEWISKQ